MKTAITFLVGWSVWATVCGAGAAEDTASFVRVSPRDSRYFELDNGKPYIPIGMNLIAPPKGDPALMDEWFGKLAAHVCVPSPRWRKLSMHSLTRMPCLRAETSIWSMRVARASSYAPLAACSTS